MLILKLSDKFDNNKRVCHIEKKNIFKINYLTSIKICLLIFRQETNLFFLNQIIINLNKMKCYTVRIFF